MRAWMGVDPGKSGAAVVLLEDGSMQCCRFDRATETEVACFFNEMQWDYGPPTRIELLHPMPNTERGVVSAFKLGCSYGFLRGCLIGAAVAFEEVRAAKWQRAMGCLSRGDKKVTRARAQQLFPDIKVIHQIADALLIAEYCRRECNGYA